MSKEIQQESKQKMAKAIESLKQNLAKVRTGRAHPSLLDSVKVTYYDQPTPLNQVAGVAVTDARTLTVTPYDKQVINDVDKAIRAADLGLNPNTIGHTIIVPLPPLTQERRNDLGKQVRQEAEQARVAIRNIRRDANQKSKNMLKAKEIGEDEDRQLQEAIQKLTDEFIKQADALSTEKESDLMQI